ncbi:protein translocase subunit SecDF [Mycoplasma simbae]|uniref:protein translocase subunit SecDF n=1 Tax=Mycoplasma simbae TaxID=36744 RepID=UPI00146FA0E8|nr:hypothetical protein [Mycoplasma simbae]
MSFFILTSSVVAISVGTTLYTSQNINKSIEYGGGQEFLISIEGKDSTANISSSEVAKSIQNRINGGNDFGESDVVVESKDKVKISKTGLLTPENRALFESLITTKSYLIFTDTSGQPLFRNGVFVEPNENNKIDWEEVILDPEKLNSFVPPIKGARPNFSSFGNGKNFVVDVELRNKDAEIEWTKLTKYLSEKQNENEKYLLTWLNIDELIRIAKDKYAAEWQNTGKNPYRFIYVNEDPSLNNGQGVLKIHSVKADNYLVNKVGVNRPLSGDRFSIPSTASGEALTQATSKKLADEISFGTSNYSLSILSSNFIPAQQTNNAFVFSLIAIGIVFAIISIFLIANYSILGLIASLAIALYLFVVFSLFGVLKGQYSPVALASILVGLGLCFNIIALSYSRLKQELYKGEKMRKATATTARSSLPYLVDVNILLILASFMMFYLGSQGLRDFSIGVVLSIIGIAFSTVLLVRICTNLLVNTKAFINKPALLGLRSKKLHASYQAKFKDVNFAKQTKWFFVAFAIITVISIIVFSVFAIYNQHWAQGFSRSLEFQGGTNITIQGKQALGVNINADLAQKINSYLINNSSRFGILNPEQVISINSLNDQNSAYSLVLKTSQVISASQIDLIKKDILATFKESLDIVSFGVSPSESISFVLNSFYALIASLAIVFVYALIRFKWTYAIALLASLALEFILMILLIVLTRIQINSIAIIALAAWLLISLSDKVILINRIKENLATLNHNDFISAHQVLAISNQALRANLKRSLYASLIYVLIGIVALALVGAIDYSFGSIIILTSAITFAINYFVLASLWVKLESKRQNGIKKRYHSKYWVLPGEDEQVFPGINDFIA